MTCRHGGKLFIGVLTAGNETRVSKYFEGMETRTCKNLLV